MHALNKTKANRSHTLMIGDSWDADIVGAYNSNIHQLWLNPEEHRPTIFTPTYSVKTLSEIKDIL